MRHQKNKYLTILFINLIAVTFLSLCSAANQTNMYYRGTMNAWGSSAMILNNLGTPNWFITIFSDGNDASSAFKLDNEKNWVGGDWSRGDVITVGALTTWYNPNLNNGTFSETNGKYYTFLFKDVANDTDSEGYILEFNSAPVSISHFDETGTGGDNTPFDFEDANNIYFKIDCGTTQPPSDQKFYVRYYFDADNVNGYVSWGTANIVGTTTTTLSASHYQALISTSKPGNATTVTFYTLSTESSLSLTNSTVDVATVYFDNNSGSNYTKSINGGSLAVDEPHELPVHFEISDIYPNPFNPETTIRYKLDSASEITLQIFDISGKLVETLFDGYSTPGEHQIIWKPTEISSGIFMVQLTDGNRKLIKQITYIK